MSKVKATPDAVYNINYHFVWIPKYRKSILRGGMKERLKEILSEIAKQYEFEIEEMSVQPDHVHLSVCLCSTEILPGEPGRYSQERILPKDDGRVSQAETTSLAGKALGKGILCWNLRRQSYRR